MKKNKELNQSDLDYEKLSNKLVLASVLLIINNKKFSDSEKIKYIKILFKG